MSPADNNQNAHCGCSLTLAIASVPKQPWVAPCDLSLALKRGTIFDNLNYPFFIGGEDHA